MIRIRTVSSLTLALLLPGLAQAQEPEVRRVVLAMGTRLSIQAEGAGQDQLTLASEAAILECGRIEAACSTWRTDSVFSHLNDAEGRAVPLDREWLALLSRASDWSRRSGGAFDPVLGQLLTAYGVRGGGRSTSGPELARARAASGAKHLHLNVQGGSAQLEGGAGIEEGGFVKGYALDRMKDQFAQLGIRSGCLDFGGQLLAFGKAREVTIADPAHRALPRFSLSLENASLASSGLSEHGRHIVDPRSGLLCGNWGSVSVIAASGLDADCLSTALYVLGPDEGLAWCKRHHVAAIFLLNDGRALLSPAVQPLKPAALPVEK